MTIFVGDKISCALNYQYYYVISRLNKYGIERTKEVEKADAIIFPASCACTDKNLMHTIYYIDSVLKNAKKDAKVYLTGCLSREFIDNPDLDKYKAYLEEKIDMTVPVNRIDDIFADLLNEEPVEPHFGAGFRLEPENNDDKIKPPAEIYISTGCLHKCSFCKTTF